MAEPEISQGEPTPGASSSGDDPGPTGPDSNDPPAARKSPLKRPGVRIGLFIGAFAILVLGGIWIFHYLTVGQYMEETDDAYLAADTVTISPKVSGYVEQVLVANNQDVQAGEALARIDARDYRAKVAQAQSQIDVAMANADAVRAQIQEQDSAIAQARAQLASARANAAFAQGEAQRYAPLAKTGAETAEQLAGKRNQAQRAVDDVAAQVAALASAEKKVASLRAQVRQAQAQGETASAQLAAANVDLQSALISSPIAGRVGDLTVRVGQYVQSGTRLMSVVPLAQLYINANFKETQIGRMRPGQPVQIKVDALSGVQLRGHVESVAPGTGAEFSLIPPQNATGNFTKIVQRVPVRIALDASDAVRRVLVPGLSVSATVDTIGAKDDLKAMRREDAKR